MFIFVMVNSWIFNKTTGIFYKIFNCKIYRSHAPAWKCSARRSCVPYTPDADRDSRRGAARLALHSHGARGNESEYSRGSNVTKDN